MTRPVPPMSLKEAREVLGVSSDATPHEVRRAFHDAAKRAHPDQGGSDAVFRQVVEAYQRLQGSLEDRPAVEAAPRSRPRAEPILEIGPQTALEGGVVDARTPEGRQVRVRLPAGLRSGDLVCAGGEFRIYIRAEAGVLVRGDDLWMTVKVSPATLKKGGRVAVDTPIGRRIVWIDRKAAERGLVRIEGQGLPARGPHPRGHMFLRLAARAGQTDSAALALLRRFAAAWAA